MLGLWVAAVVFLQVRVIQIPPVVVLDGGWLAPRGAGGPDADAAAAAGTGAVQLPWDTSPGPGHSPTENGNEKQLQLRTSPVVTTLGYQWSGRVRADTVLTEGHRLVSLGKAQGHFSI